MQPAPLILLLPFGYLGLQCAAVMIMRGRWQTAAVLPAVLMGIALASFVFAMLTGVGVAMLPLAVGLPIATVYLVCLWIFHVLVRKRGVV